MSYDVIVIGAGLSGLSAAKWLKESGLNIIVLEARDRVGGRTLTKCDSKVKYVDLGAAYIGPTQNRVLRMAKEFGIQNYKINEVEDLLHYKNGQRCRFPAMGFPQPSNPFVIMDINNIFYLIDKMSEEIPPKAPWDAPHAHEWDTMSCKDFLRKHCWTKGSMSLFESIISGLVTSESYEASLLSFLLCIKQGGGCKRIFSATNGAQERKLIGGTQQISMKIAEKLGDAVIKNSPVMEINQESGDVVLVKTLSGKEYQAKYVIMAIPPVLQMKIHFRPSMPVLRNQLMQRLPMGNIMKLIIYYTTPFWKEKGLCGTILIEGGEEHPASFTFDDTKPDGSVPAIIGIIAADKALKLCQLPLEERKNIFAKSLAKILDCKEALNPIHYEEKNWGDEQYSGGGYTAMYPQGFFTRYGRSLRAPVDRLYFAGTETAVEWSGYMEGAIEAGERAAREILHKMGKITEDKIYQTEPPSKDVIPKPFVTSLAETLLPSVPTFLKMLSLSTLSLIILGLYTQPTLLKESSLKILNPFSNMFT